MVLNLLVQNIMSNISGGAKNFVNNSPKSNLFTVMLITLILLLVKGFIVYLAYNLLMPKLIYSISNDKRTLEDIESNFIPLSYMESIIFVILANTLFSA
jgi:hypothetical protein